MPAITLMSWNVNGMRAVTKKGFLDFLSARRPHVLGVQETKLQADQVPDEVKSPPGYQVVWNHAERRGYSGTALFYRTDSPRITIPDSNTLLGLEGRVIRADFSAFTLLNIYFPNGQMSPERLEYKLRFYEQCLDYCENLRSQGRSLVISGDFNTAHNEIDLKNPGPNSDRSGFLPVERAWLDKLVVTGYVDTFRTLYPGRVEYSWWSYRFQARSRNAGWRIDYFFISPDLAEKVEDAWILTDVFGSDHCPVAMRIRV